MSDDISSFQKREEIRFSSLEIREICSGTDL